MSMMSISNIWNTEPMFQYNWHIYIVPPTAVSKWQDALTYRAKNVNIPDRSFDEVEIPYRRSKVKVLGRDSSPKSFDITGWLDVDLTLFQFMNDWQDLVSHQDTGLGVYKVDYTAQITVVQFNNNDDIVTDYTFYNVMPQSRQAMSLDYSSSEAVDLSLTFIYDKMIASAQTKSTTQNFGE